MALSSARVVNPSSRYQPRTMLQLPSNKVPRHSQSSHDLQGHSDSAYDSNGPTHFNRSYTHDNIGLYQDPRFQANTQSPGSVGSSVGGLVFQVNRAPLRDYTTESVITPSTADSDISSWRYDTDVESVGYRSSIYADSTFSTDVEGDDRYYRQPIQLKRPTPAPRTARRMYGEAHPSQLRSNELPIETSGDEIEDDSSVTSLHPVPHPRISLRMKRATTITIMEQDQIDAENKLLRPILKRSSTNPSPRFSIADSTGNSRVVRFEAVDKGRDLIRNITDYSDIDKRNSKKGKRNTDIWSHVGPVSPKRGDSQRSSGRQARSSSAQRQRSSRDRSNSRSRSGQSSGGRSRSLDRNKQPNDKRGSFRSNSSSQKQDYNGSRSRENSSTRPVEVTIQVSKNESVITSMSRENSTDIQKCIKWGLIIGVPLVLLSIAGAVVAVLLTRN